MPTVNHTSPEETSARKEVFAWYGAAAYYAQCFEQELINLLVIAARLKNPQVESHEIERLESVFSKRTMGQLVEGLSEHITLDTVFTDSFEKSRKQRNYLVHRFFFDHAVDLCSHKGCDAMVEKLRSMCDTFQAADRWAVIVRTLLLGIAGWSVEDIESFVDDYLARVTEETDSG